MEKKTVMSTEFEHQHFLSLSRVSQTLRNDRCQNILYKSVFEHFIEIKWIAALLLASKSFQNSSFGANFVVNFVVDEKTIKVFESVLSPSSCFSLQFAPSLHIDQSWFDSDTADRGISEFVGKIVSAQYLPLSLRSLKLDSVAKEVVSFFFDNSTNAWPQLRDLRLEDCELSDSVLKIVATKALQLRRLDFSESSGITDSGIKHISNLSGITFINLSCCDMITDVGFAHVSKLSGLTSLNLSFCLLITDAGLEHISELSHITSLNLACCRMITDAGLEFVSKLSSITSLNLSGCDHITDAGLAHICKKLSRITSLKLVNCRGITSGALEKLGTTLSNCNIK